ncbi:DUF3488 and transglutaminase-like domain-containing protein [Aquihabitans sp. G128]|uniref:transglutaminase family protein n=1 Tax=Aquihabitans sp. G128 TaxID=2849779 RepID=UPI001C22FFC8|nr:DUF3488 and transglutaminase-like domain-containing protein [Aquihabitans sp. G128]
MRSDRPAPLRLMVLDRFDGRSWSAATTLQEAGSTLPPERPGGRAVGTSVTQDVTLVDLPGSFLPAPDRPVAYDGPAAWWDARHGVLYRQRSTVAKGTIRYEVRSVVPVLPEQVGRRDVDDTDAATLAAPGAPARLASLALEATPSGTTAYARALLLEQFVRDRAVFDPDAAPGSSWRSLEFFLTASTDAGGRRGTSEQFATAFAALARLQGLPARVVVGARPASDAKGGTWTIRAGDLEAWPEVRFEGIGWVPFDPTPDQRSTEPPTTTTTAPTTTSPDLPPQQTTPDRTKVGPGKQDGKPGGGSAPTLADRLGDLAVPALVVVLALVLVLPLAVALAKLVRRARRRRSGGDGALAMAAWADVVDQLRSRGVVVDQTASRRVVARRAEPVVGAPAAAKVEQLARLANAVTFSGAEAPVGLGPRAWALADEVRAAAAAGQPWWRRAARLADPRTLRRPRPDAPAVPLRGTQVQPAG